MDVILQRDIPKLGKSGDIVHVKDGYARNYLFPRAYAVAATGGALKDHKARLAREKERGEKLLETAQTDSEKLQGLALTLIGKVGSGTKLYGSITAQDLAEAIAGKTGVTVDKRRVGLADPIKNLGTFTVPVRLHSDISVAVTVEVITQEESDRRAAQAAEAAAAEAAQAEAAQAAPEAPAETAE
jgi:large subunit ribosomal protein L9